jgi:uncharacterized protein
MPKHENRFIEIDDVELRTEGEAKQQYVAGLGIVYDKEVEIWPGLREKIRKGAFGKSMRSTDEVKSFFNHDASMVLATTKSDPPLYLEDTDKGLRYKAPLPPTSYGNDLSVNLSRKNVRGSSFQFSVSDEGEILTRDEKGIMHREIIDAVLYEIGPVTNPAYGNTTASRRSSGAADVFEGCRQKIEAREAGINAEQSAGDLDLRKKRLSLIVSQ